jgi:hypothetical protein
MQMTSLCWLARPDAKNSAKDGGSDASDGEDEDNEVEEDNPVLDALLFDLPSVDIKNQSRRRHNAFTLPKQHDLKLSSIFQAPSLAAKKDIELTINERRMVVDFINNNGLGPEKISLDNVPKRVRGYQRVKTSDGSVVRSADLSADNATRAASFVSWRSAVDDERQFGMLRCVFSFKTTTRHKVWPRLYLALLRPFLVEVDGDRELVRVVKHQALIIDAAQKVETLVAVIENGIDERKYLTAKRNPLFRYLAVM